MPFTWLAHDLPEDARRQLQRFTPSGLQAAALTPDGGWVVVGQGGQAGRAAAVGEPAGTAPAVAAFAARGIPDACFVCLRSFLAAGLAIRSIAFLPAERGAVGWVVVTDRQYAAADIPDDCSAALADGWAQGLRPSCVAFPPPADARADAVEASVGGPAPIGCSAFPLAAGAAAVASARSGAKGAGGLAADPAAWALLAGRTVLGRGIDAACWQRLHNLAQGLRPARQLAFAPGGGWAIATEDGVSTAGLPEACTAHFGQLAQAHVVEQLCLASNGGWLVGSATTKQVLPVDPLHAFERQFLLVAGRWRSLADRMAAHRVSGLGVAVASAGQLATVTRYGSEIAADRADWRRKAERRLCTTQPPIAGASVDASADTDADCRVQRWPAADAACAVRVEGGDPAGRAALTAEVIGALARSHGWPGPAAATGG